MVLVLSAVPSRRPAGRRRRPWHRRIRLLLTAQGLARGAIWLGQSPAVALALALPVTARHKKTAAAAVAGALMAYYGVPLLLWPITCAAPGLRGAAARGNWPGAWSRAWPAASARGGAWARPPAPRSPALVTAMARQNGKCVSLDELLTSLVAGPGFTTALDLPQLAGSVSAVIAT